MVLFMKQMKLMNIKTKDFHGGELVVGKRKCARPLCTRKPIHLVLKANKRVNLFKNSKVVKTAIHKYAVLCGMKIYSLSVQSDHIHLCIRIHDRSLYKKFIRSLTGVLARRFGRVYGNFCPSLEWGSGEKALLSLKTMCS